MLPMPNVRPRQSGANVGQFSNFYLPFKSRRPSTQNSPRPLCLCGEAVAVVVGSGLDLVHLRFPNPPRRRNHLRKRAHQLRPLFLISCNLCIAIFRRRAPRAPSTSQLPRDDPPHSAIASPAIPARTSWSHTFPHTTVLWRTCSRSAALGLSPRAQPAFRKLRAKVDTAPARCPPRAPPVR